MTLNVQLAGPVCSAHVTVVSPNGKAEPDGGLHESGRQAPEVKGGWNVTTALHASRPRSPGSVLARISAGQFMVHPPSASASDCWAPTNAEHTARMAHENRS